MMNASFRRSRRPGPPAAPRRCAWSYSSFMLWAKSSCSLRLFMTCNSSSATSPFSVSRTFLTCSARKRLRSGLQMYPPADQSGYAFRIVSMTESRINSAGTTSPILFSFLQIWHSTVFI